jgi:2-polyprenyl-3-methyl-5-hydroxy-6-metoxy-1,4-benzoquinol methylase
MDKNNNKFELQDKHYEFPYHHIPHFDKTSGVGVRTRTLGWGLEYLCNLKHIRDLIENLSPKSVLDIGCGDGRLLGMLSEKIPRRIGIDLSERAIGFAKAFHPDIEFRVADASDLDETFDLALTMEVLEHVPDEQISGFLRGLFERVNKGGHVILSVPTIAFPVQTKHYRHYEIALLKSQLRDAGVTMKIGQVEYIFKQDFPLFFGMIDKLTQNRWWTLEADFFRKLLWRYIWEKHRFATEKNGRHLITVLKKC